MKSHNSGFRVAQSEAEDDQYRVALFACISYMYTYLGKSSEQQIWKLHLVQITGSLNGERFD